MCGIAKTRVLSGEAQMVPEHKHQSMYSPHMDPSVVDELAQADCGYMLDRQGNDQLDLWQGPV